MANDIFERENVSSKISADEAPKIFQKYGIFYQPDAALARIAKNLGASIGDREGFDQLKNAIFHDQVFKMIHLLETSADLHLATEEHPRTLLKLPSTDLFSPRG